MRYQYPLFNIELKNGKVITRLPTVKTPLLYCLIALTQYINLDSLTIASGSFFTLITTPHLLDTNLLAGFLSKQAILLALTRPVLATGNSTTDYENLTRKGEFTILPDRIETWHARIE